ncbi:hypothetical protein GGI12_006042 [Dipsacomyces acuminosporus]|nr:hypothetical protein GGI12_006042 [Dipsacomyces acuminosporus]
MKTLAATAALAVTLAANCLGYSLSAWEGTGYSGREFRTSGDGTQFLGFYAQSYVWDSSWGDGCCVKFCDNGRETGYWCPSHENSNVASGSQFNKVITGCDDTVLNC